MFKFHYVIEGHVRDLRGAYYYNEYAYSESLNILLDRGEKNWASIQ